MKRNMTGKRQAGLPPYGLQSELLSINAAKRRMPGTHVGKGTVWCERRGGLRKQFGGREKELWSPEFYREWLEYVRAVESGELSGY